MAATHRPHITKVFGAGPVTHHVVEYRFAGQAGSRVTIVLLSEGYTTVADIPTIIAIPAGRSADEVTVLGSWQAPACEWFAKCENYTAQALEHPVLGVVPCCQRCARKVGASDRLQLLDLS